MNKKQYEEFQKSIRECQQRSQRTLNNIDSTLTGVRETIRDIQETNNNIDKIEKQYNQVMVKLAQKVARSFFNSQNLFKKVQGVDYKNLPKQISQQQAIQKALNHRKILIITGAGVSVDSGIPTFRGKGGLYSKRFQYNGKKYDPEEFLTLGFYKQNPEQIWKWIDQIYNLSNNSKSNEVHMQIHKLAKKLAQKGLQVVLATQNIDNLHIKPTTNEYQYYEIHGNCKKVRCKNHHFEAYSPNSKSEKCKKCDEPYRPHILFFDECYGKNYGGEIKDRQFSFVICIGSSIKTGLAITMLQRAEEIIQINPQPIIEYGKVYLFSKNTLQTLKQLNKALE